MRKLSAIHDKQIDLVKHLPTKRSSRSECAPVRRSASAHGELSESLEQQTATAEVLKVISSSSGELEPVFNAMLENATRICEAKFGMLWFREGNAFRAVATHNAPAAFAEHGGANL